MSEKTVCVIGYGEIPLSKRDYLKQELEREISTALEDGYRTFMAEYREGAGLLFIQCVHERRVECTDIFSEIVISQGCEQFDDELLSMCNDVKLMWPKYQNTYPLGVTRYLIGNSSRVIAVFRKRGDYDTAYALDYARVMGRDFHIIQM